MTQIDPVENLKHHVANEVYKNFEEIARRYGISQKAAYYAFLGFMPSDTSALSKKEIAVIKAFSEKKPDIGKRQPTAPKGTKGQ